MSYKHKKIVKLSNIIFTLPLLLIICSVASKAQDEVIQIGTDLVIVPTVVLDRDGRYITNLKKEDFQIFDNNIEQEIEIFDSVEQPFTVILLFDVSSSMSNQLVEMAQAANTFISQLRPNSQVSAASFADKLLVFLKPTKVSDLRKGIKIRQHSSSYTRLYDAVHDTLKMIKSVRGRKAIVLFSDGAGDGIFASAKDNFRKAAESEALIYTVQFNTFPATPHPNVNKNIFYKRIEEANNYMRDLAQITGGRSYQIEKIDYLEKTFRSIADELLQQYSLGYYPKQMGGLGERRQIRVRVNIPNVAVRARDNYVVDSSKKRQK